MGSKQGMSELEFVIAQNKTIMTQLQIIIEDGRRSLEIVSEIYRGLVEGSEEAQVSAEDAMKQVMESLGLPAEEKKDPQKPGFGYERYQERQAKSSGQEHQ